MEIQLIELEILKEKGYFLVPKHQEGKIEEGMSGALAVEIVKGFNRSFCRPPEVTATEIIRFFTVLNNVGKLKTQPFFPKVLPVKFSESFGQLCTKEVIVLTREELAEKLLRKRIIDLKDYEYKWLSDYYKYDRLNYRLFNFFSKYIKGGKLIGVGRSVRKEFMERIETYLTYEKLKNPKYIEYPLISSMWKKIIKIIHPLDYSKTYPLASSFFNGMNLLKKIEPPKQKLKNIIRKGWENGTDFENFEEYLDQPSLTTRDILISLRDYERSPRITRYKKTKGIELGKRKPDPEELEIVDLIKLQLKEKFLKKISPRKETLYQAVHDNRSITYLLKNPLTLLLGIQIKDDVKEIEFIINNAYIQGFTVENGKSWPGGVLKIDDQVFMKNFFITAYFQDSSIKEARLDIKINKVETKIIYFEKEASSMILFHYDSNTKFLKWVEEPGKIFYSGNPNGIESWEYVEKVLLSPPTITISELCGYMYTISEEGQVISTEDLVKDIGLNES